MEHSATLSPTGISAASIQTRRMDSFRGGGDKSLIIPSMTKKKALLLHFHSHLQLICIYSCIITDGGALKARQILQLLLKNDSIGRDELGVI